ncbi:MAG: TRAP transporter large permease [Oscillospiraceae bacterium]|nr:TRAP transporter large permease [Oscillospiraceae bacterium]
MSPVTVAILGIIVMLIMMFLGMNIGMAMLVVGFAGYWMVVGQKAAVGMMQTIPAQQAITYSFTVIPLFILMGNAAFAAGLSQGLFDAGRKWLSRLPGSLSCATIAACAAFGAICGSNSATCATMGVIAIPEMKKYNYAPSLATGCVAAGGTLGVLIPPSTPMIIYGIAAEQSIGRLFAGGVIPGVLCALLMMCVVWIAMRVVPGLAPKGFSCSWAERFKSLKGIIGVAFLFACVLGGMFIGFFTVNEAASVGALLGLLLMVVRRRMNWRSFVSVMKDTVKTSSMVFLLLIGATVFGNFLAVTRMPMMFANYIEGLEVSKYVVLALIIVIYAFLGCIMDALPMMMLTVPIFYPIITGLGFDGVWFGIIIVLVMNLGNITPPVGLSCYVIAGIAKDTPLYTIFKGALPFSFAMLASIVICTMFPQIVIWLPNLIYGL